MCVVINTFWVASTIQGQSKPPEPLYIIDIKANISNVKAINLSTIGKEIKYIPLETRPECLLQNIMNVEFSDEYIFVNDDNNQLLQFDLTGKFIRKIGTQGRGPEEYLYMFDFCLNKATREIYILSYPSRMVFGFDGKFKKSLKQSGRPAQMLFFKPAYFFYQFPNVSSKELIHKYSWMITDINEVTIRTYKTTLRRYSMPGYSLFRTTLYLYDDCPHFMDFAVDTMYYLSGLKKMPYAVFNLGNLKIEPDVVITPATNAEVSDRLRDKYYIRLGRENNTYMFVELAKGLTNNDLNLIYNKKTNETIVLKENGFKNDLDGGISFWPKFIFNDNMLVSYVESIRLLKSIKELQSDKSKGKAMSEQLKNLGKTITEESNPVLVVVR